VAEKRRQYGSGSVYQRKDGRWVGRIEAGWSANGTRRRIAVVAATEPACKAAIKACIKKLENEGAPVAGVTNRATVKTWADVWLDRTVNTKRPKSWDTDASNIRKWVIPTIGVKRLDLLTPGDIRAVTIAIRKAGRSTSTARRVHQVVTKMLKDAVLEGHAIPQRVLMVEAPATAVNDRDAIPLPDAIDILQAASERMDGSRWAAGLMQGTRQAETLGLRWSHIDLDAGLMDISWQLQAIPYKHGCHDEDNKITCKRRFGGDCTHRGRRIPDGYEIKPLDGALCLVRPKTEKGKRVIPLVPWMVSALQAWRHIAPASPHDLVWPRPDGRPQRVDLDNASWVEIQDAAQVAAVDGTEGRRYGIHEMRHTCGSLLQESGVDDPTITAILGHASIVASRVYIHVKQTATRAAMEKVASKLQLI
jgi:integrase